MTFELVGVFKDRAEWLLLCEKEKGVDLPPIHMVRFPVLLYKLVSIDRSGNRNVTYLPINQLDIEHVLSISKPSIETQILGELTDELHDCVNKECIERCAKRILVVLSKQPGA